MECLVSGVTEVVVAMGATNLLTLSLLFYP